MGSKSDKLKTELDLKADSAQKRTVKNKTPEISTEPGSVKDLAGSQTFALERMQRDCLKLFGISKSTFAGASLGLTGEFTIKEIREKINKWQNTKIKKEDN
ncbi:MAG: hypothetical protein LBR74_00185 [Eubacterium sp.]|jgi:hypothetical protein|nr:hypothetical protein [Eubacterium sp.]